MNNVIEGNQQRDNPLYFEEAVTRYNQDGRALTIEGLAGHISTPNFAVQSLESYAKVARDMDKLAESFAS